MQHIPIGSASDWDICYNGIDWWCVMFKNNSNIVSLSEDIFLYKNFISENEAEALYKKCIDYSDEIWNSVKNSVVWYNGKTTSDVAEARELFKKVNDLVFETHTPTPSYSFVRMFTGDSMHEHTDTCGDEEATANDDFNTCSITDYGVVIYLNNDYEGGEISYPDLGISYKPSPGDLIIHNARIAHEVKEVISGTRYCYPTFLIKNELRNNIAGFNDKL